MADSRVYGRLFLKPPELVPARDRRRHTRGGTSWIIIHSRFLRRDGQTARDLSWRSFLMYSAHSVNLYLLRITTTDVSGKLIVIILV